MYTEAIEYYSKVIALDKNSYYSHYKVGISKLNIARNIDDYYTYLEAADSFINCLSIEPDYWSAYYCLVETSERTGQLNEILKYLSKIRKFDFPDNEKMICYCKYINYLMINQQDDEVLIIIREVDRFLNRININAASKEIIAYYYNLKGIYYSSICYDTALKCFKDANDLFPNEFNKNALDLHLKGQATHYLEYGDVCIVKGGAKPRAPLQ